jgi:sodium transport system permease protein
MQLGSAFRELRTLFVREVKHMLRDRHTMIYTVAIPLFFYPFTLFAVLQSVTVIRGWKDQHVSTVLFDTSQSEPLMQRLLENDAKLRLLPTDSPERDGKKTPDHYRELLIDKTVDAVLSLSRRARVNAGNPEDSVGSVQAEIFYSSVRDNSVAAKSRLEASLISLRESLLTLKVQDLDQGEGFLEVINVEQNDFASGERKANFVLSLILPLLMVVIIVMGAFYPALDATAGERERRTLETTLIAPVSRRSIVVAKYLAVCAMAMLAFLLNFASMTFSLKHVLVQINVQSFRIPWTSMVIVTLAATVLAGLVTALLLLLAFRARSFKEGQSYMSPVYLIAVLPVALTFSPDVELNSTLASIPIVNVTLVFREVLQSRFDWPLIVQALCFSCAYSTLAIYLSAKFVSSEKFLLGGGSKKRRPFAFASRLPRKSRRNV